ncbi:MAG TPA: sigma-70 family RNA polymerase sigma factor [Actinomycetota bacterium]|nr:sigma-70 family RNA polymerase sigma factor [Actinomycetota bacterium]
MPEQQAVAASADAAVVERLLAGDERTFMMMVDQHQPAMLRLAQMYVSSRAVAEECVQEAWIGILRGLPTFEARSSLRTWMYKIVTNVAKTRGVREGRSIPFSALAGDHDDPVDPSWFQGPDDPFPGGWRTFPDDWRGIPEDRLLGRETLDHIARALDSMPAAQAEVVRLRDVQGWSSDEVCNALDLTETNQRVLLHRGRSRIRRELDAYLSEGRDR